VWTRDAFAGLDEATAMRFAAFWAAHNLICDQVAALPLNEFRGTADGPVEVVPSSLLQRPSALIPREEWLWGLVSALLLHGNAWGWVTALTPDGWPQTIELLDPTRVTAQVTPDGGVVFRVAGVEEQRWPAGRLWHLPARVPPGSVVGQGVLARARASLKVGLMATSWAGAFFEDGAHPTLVVSTTDPINQEQAEVVKDRVRRVMAGRRDPLVLGGGWRADTVQLTPEDAQFLGSVNASAMDVARWFGVPPEFVGVGVDGASLTYQNVESRLLLFRQITLTPWLVRIERALSDLLPRGRYVRFNRDAVVAVDLATRVEAHDKALRAGWRTVNEVRRLEDLPPVPDGDRLLWPPYAQTAQTVEPAPAPPPAPPSRRELRARRGADGTWIVEEDTQHARD
jgi:HK97 family phage portal protein